jgi:hypothetical protein
VTKTFESLRSCHLPASQDLSDEQTHYEATFRFTNRSAGAESWNKSRKLMVLHNWKDRRYAFRRLTSLPLKPSPRGDALDGADSRVRYERSSIFKGSVSPRTASRSLLWNIVCRLWSLVHCARAKKGKIICSRLGYHRAVLVVLSPYRHCTFCRNHDLPGHSLYRHPLRHFRSEKADRLCRSSDTGRLDGKTHHHLFVGSRRCRSVDLGHRLACSYRPARRPCRCLLVLLAVVRTTVEFLRC